jgi:hypothetical protein
MAVRTGRRGCHQTDDVGCGPPPGSRALRDTQPAVHAGAVRPIANHPSRDQRLRHGKMTALRPTIFDPPGGPRDIALSQTDAFHSALAELLPWDSLRRARSRPLGRNPLGRGRAEAAIAVVGKESRFVVAHHLSPPSVASWTPGARHHITREESCSEPLRIVFPISGIVH